jgi:hypothetical protein
MRQQHRVREVETRDVAQSSSEITATQTDALQSLRDDLHSILCDVRRRLKTVDEKIEEACRVAKRDAV